MRPSDAFKLRSRVRDVLKKLNAAEERKEYVPAEQNDHLIELADVLDDILSDIWLGA